MRQLTRVTSSVSLSATERAQLIQCEDVITTAKRWQAEEAKAFLMIREKRLWRGKYASFEAYGLQRWQIEHSRLYQICAWGEVIRNVSTIVESIPERESHARPLYGLPAEQQRIAWRSVCRVPAHKRTAADVQSVVDKMLSRRTREVRVTLKPAPEGDIIRADAIDGVSHLKDSSVDLFLFSPPYCEQRRGQYPGVSESDFPDWLSRVMAAIAPKLRPKGSVLVVAREHVQHGQISDVWLRTRLSLRRAGWLETDTLIWVKPDAPPLGRVDRMRRTFEYIYWFSRTPNPYVDPYACGRDLSEEQMRRLRPRHYKRARTHGERREGLYSQYRTRSRARLTDVIEAHVGKGIPPNINHPAMYPEELCDTLIRTFCPATGLVADCFAGSGTTLVSARNAGRAWWGCDIMDTYVAAARKRLNLPSGAVRK
jgi:DNA modification methylase